MAQDLGSILKKGPRWMQQALSSSKEQHIIQNLIHQYLPESFHEHITVEYIRSGVVSIWIDQQMWLSRFHYEKTTTKKLHKQYLNVYQSISKIIKGSSKENDKP